MSLNKIASYLFLFTTTFAIAQPQPFKYPILKPTPVTETVFGRRITDDYRGLENLNTPEAQQWLQEEKKLTTEVLSSISNYDQLKKEMEEAIALTNVGSGIPIPTGNKLFFVRNYIREKNQKLVCSINDKETELLSTNSMNTASDTYSIDYIFPSYDGNYLALGISSNGAENSTMYILDVTKKTLLPDRIPRCMGGNPQWIRNKNAFFYNQYKEIKNAEDLKTKYENPKIKLHIIGTDSNEDVIIFSKDNNPDFKLQNLHFPVIYTNPLSDKILLLIGHAASSYSQFYYSTISSVLDTKNKSIIEWKKLAGMDSKVLNGVIKDNDFICLSYKNNTNGKVEKVSLSDTSQRTMLYQSDKNVINDIMPTNEGVYLKTLQNGTYKLMQISFKDFSSNEIQLPMQGGIMLKDMSECPPTYQNSKNLYFRFISPIEPQAIYSYTPEVNKVLRIKCIPEQVKSDIELVVKEVEVPSYDGVMVPLTIVYPKNCVLNGQNPTLISAYGAYGWIYDVKYDAKFLPWFKRGGVYAVAHVRGGGEKGDAWHDGGLKATKPNTWKDMIACTEYLIANKYTSPAKLCVEGRSAGSIMVGRTITERPDLYKAAIIGVGIPNTIREMSNTMGGAEYGSVKDSTEFQYLYEMDTYHHVFKEKKYPSILFSTALKDARVDPWQPAKGIAKFQQACTEKDNLILFRISDQGHFEERNNAKVFADQFSFIFWQLGHPEFQLTKN
jgi:prolyl oligopeptidase